MGLFQSNLEAFQNQYTSFRVRTWVIENDLERIKYSGFIQLPYKLGAKNTPNMINSYLMPLCTDSNGYFNKTTAEIQQLATNNPSSAGVDCSGLVYYVLNEASYGAVNSFFNVSYAYGVSANNLATTVNGVQKTSAKQIVPGCTFRMDNGNHVAVVYKVETNSSNVVTRIWYAHSNGSKGPHTAYIDIGNENYDLKSSYQTWHDIAYTDSTAKSLYNYTVLLNCVANQS
ncbi:hypothetical protein JK636_17525 [Clostridium sp. YIM B02515]|uniref:Uncharacterized protein n=1 Tax=Clostridium rhizosphaerae TaxID=2803861 RepID=A0ABS1TDT2_9CLOT|nr:hypothetical protein [Clostridium rhizosphaerae]MBL4937524.1 hypothetical protein [Clostridium rhizosphaerae]